MNLKSILIALVALTLSTCEALAQATLLPSGEVCFSALAPTSGGPNNTGTGFIGLLGPIIGGSGYTNGTYGGVPLTGGNGSNATANITVSGGIVTQVAILNPGVTYVVGDVLSAAAANIGGTGSGFSVPISSVSLNYALAGGSVAFYIPNTLTIKQTWQNSGQTILNQNPVPLDANGCAIIYGSGIYRQILKDSLGNTVWDQLTSSTSPVGIFWAGLAGGTGNAITITDSSFALQDGATIQFRALANNTGPTTISVSGGSPIAVVVDTTSGPAALSGGEIDTFNMPIVSYDATNVEFHLVNPAVSTGGGGTSGTGLTPPQGYLNLVGQASGDVVQTGDVISAFAVFYSPFVGNTIPIWNGSVFKSVVFSELESSLTAAGSAANAIQDVCMFSNNGVPTLVIGPAWTTSTVGAGNRGTGPGSAQITRLQGIWVNAVSITGYNGLSSYTIAANQCTYVGSLSIDGTAGQVSAYSSYGQSRKWGVWNAYNRQPVQLQAGDSTATWVYGTNTLRPANNNTANSLQIFSGLPEGPYTLRYLNTALNNGATSTIGIGYNSTTVASGYKGSAFIPSGSTQPLNAIAAYNAAPALGINVITALEASANGGTTFDGTAAGMVLTAQWPG
jgi:hypothetical protein